MTTAHVAVTLSKTAFAISLLRLVRGKGSKIFLWTAIIVLNVAYAIATVLGWARHCDEGLEEAPALLPIECISAASRSAGLGIAITISGVLDMVLALFPWSIVWKLKLRKAEKLGICVAMSLGVLWVLSGSR
ncbi:uncharacterized protein B0I36DRAFT_13841 [Microdochium trichocladiopsis]|uniref:Rhodopsin domain-containing protein n=1 Tax=Microdochium trichocladiopsis TaxID=1682393 RepID=A0A9P9C015_9PEZI|nr:uncharacterized protein B0I36DRAFT_13841 [Microdochium trichocladiopsis]KAH7040679.1 hypothetical protein B0I36DRAFT_13841 [Microdochium trichocladiopsis]